MRLNKSTFRLIFINTHYTHLELEHVTAMIHNMNTEVINVPRVWATTGSVFHVPSDIKGDARIGFSNFFNSVAIVFWVVAPWNIFHRAWLKIVK